MKNSFGILYWSSFQAIAHFIVMSFLLSINSSCMKAMEGEKRTELIFEQFNPQTLQNTKNRKRKIGEEIPLFSVEKAKVFAIICKEMREGIFQCIITSNCKYVGKGKTHEECATHILKHIPFFRCLCGENLYCLKIEEAQNHTALCKVPVIVRNNDAAQILEQAKKNITKEKWEHIEEQLSYEKSPRGLSDLQKVLIKSAVKKWKKICKSCGEILNTSNSFENHILWEHLRIYRCAVCGKSLKGHSKKDASVKHGQCIFCDTVMSNNHIIEVIPYTQEEIEELAKEFDVERELNKWIVEQESGEHQQTKKSVKRKREKESGESESNVHNTQDLL